MTLYRVEALYKGVWRGMYGAPRYEISATIDHFLGGTRTVEEWNIVSELAGEVDGWLAEPSDAGAFPAKTKYWFTEVGWKKFHSTELIDWYLQSLDEGVEDIRVLVTEEPVIAVYKDSNQIAF